jgi:hypothetical protein
LVILLLALGVSSCYWQVSSHQLVWDTEHIFRNEQLRTFSWDNTIWIFTHAVIANWHPVSWISHTLDFTLFGWAPRGHHLISIFIHFLNGILVYLLVKMLLLRSTRIDPVTDETKVILISVLSALLFVLHPLRVESVAWVAERKDLLYSFFTLLSIKTYILYFDSENKSSRRRYYGISLILFVLALLSKSMAVTLPVVLLVLDCFALNRVRLKDSLLKPGEWLRITRQILPDKLAYFGFSFAVIIITIITQTDSIATTALTFTQQILNTIHNIGFYLWRLFVPLNLSPFYPYPPLDELVTLSYWLPALIAILIFSVMSFVMAIRGNPVPLCCWLIYLVTLSPVSGIIPVGSAIYADRYAYLTLLPIIVLLSIALVNIFQIFPRFRSITFAFILFSLIALGMLTHAQVSYWKTPITLWTHVLKLYPDAALAHRNISAAYNLMGYHEQALDHLEYISHQGWDVDQKLAGTLALVNQIPRALALYEKMILSGNYTEEESEAFKLEIERLQRTEN